MTDRKSKIGFFIGLVLIDFGIGVFCRGYPGGLILLNIGVGILAIWR